MLNERFFNTYNFSNHDNNKFILLRKGVKESDKAYFLEVHVQYMEKLHEVHDDLPFENYY